MPTCSMSIRTKLHGRTITVNIKNTTFSMPREILARPGQLLFPTRYSPMYTPERSQIHPKSCHAGLGVLNICFGKLRSAGKTCAASQEGQFVGKTCSLARFRIGEIRKPGADLEIALKSKRIGSHGIRNAKSGDIILIYPLIRIQPMICSGKFFHLKIWSDLEFTT